MKGKKKKILISILCVLIVGVSFTLGYFTRFWTTNKEIRTLEEILKVYKKHYYYETDDIIGTITGSLFDKFSAYYTPEEYAVIKSASKGEKVGIGLTTSNDDLKIVKVTGNSPCERAGIKAGGYLRGIDVGKGRVNLTGSQDLQNAINSVSENKPFTLFVDYGGVENSYIVKKCVYESSFVHYVDDGGYYSFLDDSGSMRMERLREGENFLSEVGYIELSAFNGKENGLNGVVGQFKASLDKFKESGKTHLVLDLRGNGGGYLDILVDIASHLIYNDGVGEKLNVTYSEDKYKKRENYYTTSDYLSYGYEKITVLADKNTASASEALIGAMLDYHTAYNLAELEVIVEGSSTYGKGIMQTTYTTLVGAVKLTTAKVYFPLSNTNINGVGINEGTSPLVKCVEEGSGLDRFYAEK